MELEHSTFYLGFDGDEVDKLIVKNKSKVKKRLETCISTY